MSLALPLLAMEPLPSSEFPEQLEPADGDGGQGLSLERPPLVECGECGDSSSSPSSEEEPQAEEEPPCTSK